MKRCGVCGDRLGKVHELNCAACSSWAQRLFKKFARMAQLRQIHEILHSTRGKPVEFNIAKDYVLNAMVQNIAEEV